MKKDLYNIGLIYESIGTRVTIEEYYESLNDYLIYLGLRLGANTVNPAIPYNNPDQKGIYQGEEQIGKIERIIKNDILTLEHMRSYVKGQNLLAKIYTHDEAFAASHGLRVYAELVNPYAKKEFLNTFKDWSTQLIGPHKVLATQNAN